MRPLALVTGASTGIGREIARELAQRGYDVVAAADETRIHETARDVTDDSVDGAQVLPVQVDLSRREGVEELYDRARGHGRPIEVLALNAGVGVSGRFDQNDLEDELNLVDLNVRSTVHLAHLVVRDMVATGHGRVLVTSSISAVTPAPFHATYAASKAFGHSFSQALRHELKDTGVTVTSLMPGPTDTEYFDRADMGDTRLGAKDDKDDPAQVAREGLDSLFAGKASVVPGPLRNRLQAELGTHAPDSWATPITAKVTEPGGAAD